MLRVAKRIALESTNCQDDQKEKHYSNCGQDTHEQPLDAVIGTSWRKGRQKRQRGWQLVVAVFPSGDLVQARHGSRELQSQVEQAEGRVGRVASVRKLLGGFQERRPALGAVAGRTVACGGNLINVPVWNPLVSGGIVVATDAHEGACGRNVTRVHKVKRNAVGHEGLFEVREAYLSFFLQTVRQKGFNRLY